MVALSGIFAPLRIVCIEGPTILEFLAIPIPGGKDGSSIVTTAKNGTGTMSVEIPHSSQHTVATVGIVVAPILKVAALGDVGFGVHGCTCQTIEHGDVFGTREDTSRHGTALAIVPAPFAAWRRLRCFVSLGGTMPIIGLRVADDFALAINRTIGGLDHHFGKSVAIEVIDDERHIMCATAYVDTHVDAPKQSTVKPIAIEECQARIAIMRVVVSIRRIPFEEDFVLSVAIDITHRGIVGRIGVGAAVGRLSLGRALQA